MASGLTHRSPALADEDRALVDLVSSALVDPDIHTDTRMRLADEIARLLRTTCQPRGLRASGAGTGDTLAIHADHLPKVLESVLTDPNLHTDTRMHLYDQIREMLVSAGGLRPANG